MGLGTSLRLSAQTPPKRAESRRIADAEPGTQRTRKPRITPSNTKAGRLRSTPPYKQEVAGSSPAPPTEKHSETGAFCWPRSRRERPGASNSASTGGGRLGAGWARGERERPQRGARGTSRLSTGACGCSTTRECPPMSFFKSSRKRRGRDPRYESVSVRKADPHVLVFNGRSSLRYTVFDDRGAGESEAPASRSGGGCRKIEHPHATVATEATALDRWRRGTLHAVAVRAWLDATRRRLPTRAPRARPSPSAFALV